jgi:gliding motility-associated-like protein
VTNGNVVGNSDTVFVATTEPNQEFCLLLSEQCGSPPVQTCVIVANPEPIVPVIVPDIAAGCSPITFTFYNNSTNNTQIASTYFNFGNGEDTLVQGVEPVSSYFTHARLYSVQVQVTSVFGCTYEAFFPNIVEVYPLPYADFVFSANPTTELETMVEVLNNSSSNVVTWNYQSPGSVPNASSEVNPTFWFEPGVINAYDVQLIVESDHGCFDTVVKTLNVVPAITFFAPNTFTPNGDEFNQTWQFFAAGIDASNFKLSIYNRWGQVIWETNDPSRAWDGTFNNAPVQSGIYTWKAVLKDMYSDGIQELSGMINVMF